MYVKWDFENNKVIYGPQGINSKMGDDWIPFVSHIEHPIHEGEYIITEYVAEEHIVVRKKVGTPIGVYKHQRAKEYAGIVDQLDALWHDIDNNTLDSTGAFYTLIAEIKNKYPKEEI